MTLLKQPDLIPLFSFSPHISHIPNYTLGYQKSEVCKVFCHNPWKNNFIRKGAEEAEPESGRNTTFGKRCISLIENRLENSSWTIPPPPPPLFFFFLLGVCDQMSWVQKIKVKQKNPAALSSQMYCTLDSQRSTLNGACHRRPSELAGNIILTWDWLIPPHLQRLCPTSWHCQTGCKSSPQ